MSVPPIAVLPQGETGDLSPRTLNSSFGGSKGSMAGSEFEAEVVLLRTQQATGVSENAPLLNSLSTGGLSSAGSSGKFHVSQSRKHGGLRPEALGENDFNEGRGRGRNYWNGFLTIPIYVAYAILLKLQSHLRSHLFISSGTLHSTFENSTVVENGDSVEVSVLVENGAASRAAYIFGLAVSFYYVGCFLFRIGHNVLLGWKLNIPPRKRVVVGYIGMSCALLLLTVLFYGVFPSSGLTNSAEHVHQHSSVLIAVLGCYFLAGCSLATFEPNVLSTLTAHGPRNKVLAIGAIPLATNSVACSALFALGLASAAAVKYVEISVYTVGVLICILGALVFRFKIEPIDFEASRDDAKKFWMNLKKANQWIGKMKWLCLAAYLDEITLSMSIAIGQYIYGVDQVPLLSPFVSVDSPTQHFLKHDYYLVIFFFCGFLGGTISRFLTYDFKLRNPLVYLVINCLGITCILSKAPIFAPLGMFCIMYGNGCIYASIARSIDENIPHEFNLVAHSIWLCCADLGGFTGANAVVPVHASLGSVGNGWF